MTCLICRKERDTRIDEGARFDGEVFARTLPAVLGRAATAPVRARRRHAPIYLTAGLTLAAAAAFALWARPNRSGTQDPGADVQTKGSFDLMVYARHRGAIKTLDRYDQTVYPGAEVRFVLAGTPSDMRFALIASIDARGLVSIYFPYRGSVSAEIPRAGRWEAPGSIVLDDTLGPERVFAILSPHPLTSAAVEAALAPLAAGGPDAVRDIDTLDLPGTKQQSFLLLKQAAP
ncbi:MAG TPA: hypothetical protein VGF45_19520 [Polyangia bacterium]